MFSKAEKLNRIISITQSLAPGTGTHHACSINSSRRPFSRLLNSLLGNDANSAGLRPSFSLLLDKPDSRPDLQSWKGWAKNAVLVKIDLAPVIRSQKCVTFARNNLARASIEKRCMTLYVASLATSVILQTPSRIEEVIDFLPSPGFEVVPRDFDDI